jgi:hypothetical protein
MVSDLADGTSKLTIGEPAFKQYYICCILVRAMILIIMMVKLMAHTQVICQKNK